MARRRSRGGARAPGLALLVASAASFAVILSLTAASAAQDDDARGVEVLPYSWSDFVADCGKASHDRDKAAAQRRFEERYKHWEGRHERVVEWTGHIWDVVLPKHGGGEGRLKIKMLPSDAWLHDLTLAFDVAAFPPRLFAPKVGITFRAAALSHGKSLWDHVFELRSVVMLYDGAHDMRHVFDAAAAEGDASRAGDLVGAAHLSRLSWPDFVRQCGGARRTTNEAAAYDAFAASYAGKAVKWAGRVWAVEVADAAPVSPTADVDVTGLDGWQRLGHAVWRYAAHGVRSLWGVFSVRGVPDGATDLLPASGGDDAGGGSAGGATDGGDDAARLLGSVWVKMRPSDAWRADLRLLVFAGAGDDVASSLLRARAGDDVWFEATFAAHGGAWHPHDMVATALHRVPADLASGHAPRAWEL